MPVHITIADKLSTANITIINFLKIDFSMRYLLTCKLIVPSSYILTLFIYIIKNYFYASLLLLYRKLQRNFLYNKNRQRSAVGLMSLSSVSRFYVYTFSFDLYIFHCTEHVFSVIFWHLDKCIVIVHIYRSDNFTRYLCLSCHST